MTAQGSMVIGPYDYDDDLIEGTRRDRRPRVRVYPFDRIAVVIGRGSRPGLELYLDRCVADGVPVLRRHGGGCAVLLDPGNVIVSVVIPAGGILGSRRWFRQLSEWLIEGLKRVGIEGVLRAGVSDLVVGGRKVSGACIHRSKDLLFYSATLLVKPDLAKVDRYLRHPPREPDYRQGRPHAQFMGSLDPSLPSGGIAAFADRLHRSLPTLPTGPE